MAIKTNDQKKVVEKIVENLLGLMGVGAKVSVDEDVAGDGFMISLDCGEEKGLLIGHHGETINALQVIASLIFRQRTGEWKRLVVNIGDWREKQEERLRALAEQVAQRAVETSEAQPLYNLTSAQRRIIHLYLSDNKAVETESLGEGKDRYLLIKPKS